MVRCLSQLSEPLQVNEILAVKVLKQKLQVLREKQVTMLRMKLRWSSSWSNFDSCKYFKALALLAQQTFARCL